MASRVNLLAIDTSTDRAALAVATASGDIHVATPDPALRHGRSLVPTLATLLRDAGLALADLDGLVVGLGPGSYTGLRIGLTAAKTLAYASGKPLVGLDSLEVVAQNAPPDALLISVIADAQRGDVYSADFARAEPSAPLLRTSPTRIEPRTEWASRLPEGTLVLGPALDRNTPPLPDSPRTLDPALNRPEPRQLALLALATWETGRRDDPFFLEPLYLRRSAAEEQWDRKVKAV